MSELMPNDGDVPELTKEQAEEIDRQICSVAGDWAFGLYYIKTTKAYKRLNFSSFEEYCEDRFAMQKMTADNWIVRVRVYLIAHGIDAVEFAKRYNGFTFSEKLLSVRTSRMLNSLDTEHIVEGWKMLHRTGAVNLPVANQIEEMTRWGRREGFIEPPPRRVVQDQEDAEEEPKWCCRCGKVQPLPGSDFCSWCQDKRRNEAKEQQAASMVDDFMEVQTVAVAVSSVPVVGFHVEGDAVERMEFKAPTPQSSLPVLRHNGRQVINAAMTITADDPEVRFVLCTVPAGMCLREGDPFTVAVIKCQIP